MAFVDERKSLLSSNAIIQAPFVKVTIGSYTFGVFTQKERQLFDNGIKYKAFDIQYPNYVNSLEITKINGQVNKYSLQISYPVLLGSDPNFFEKVFSSVSNTRKIKFTYGDATKPSFIYKDEEAIITNINTSFGGFGGRFSSVISYSVEAVSESALSTASILQKPTDGALHKPSDLIKALFKDPSTGLKDTFTGMSINNLDSFVAGDDQAVSLDSKLNISAIDYLSYLVSCMVPLGAATAQTSKDIYILTIHDDTVYDRLTGQNNLGGPYFKVEKVSYASEHSDAYQVDIGSPTSKDIVLSFSINNQQNYSLYYDYQGALTNKKYVRRLNSDGDWEDVYAPTITSKNNQYETRASDQVWWTKLTKFPISATLKIQGLLRPAQLMTYLRLRVIFPGGQKHISSGLYIITSQQDSISGSGYTTTLGLTRISGDNEGDQVI